MRPLVSSHVFALVAVVLIVHFWANDDAVKLARGLKAALDQTNSQK